MAEKKNPQNILDERTYSKTYSCFNCREAFTKVFRFGEVAHKGACTNCGVSDRDLRDKYKYKEDF